MEDKKLRTMRIEFSQHEGSDDYILGRITSVIDVNLDNNEYVFIFGDTTHQNLCGLRFWATDEQCNKICGSLKKIIPINIVNVKLYNVNNKTEVES